MLMLLVQQHVQHVSPCADAALTVLLLLLSGSTWPFSWVTWTLQLTLQRPWTLLPNGASLVSAACQPEAAVQGFTTY